MIESIKVTNHLGESVLLELKSPEKSGLAVRRIDGLGPVKATLNTLDIASIDGVLFNSATLGSRNIVFDFKFVATATESIEDLRRKTYKYFPIRRNVTLEINTTSRKGIAEGYVESNEPNIFSPDSSTIISVLCPSALFNSDVVVETVFSGSIPNFEFPFENASTTEKLIETGFLLIDKRKTVYYEGDIATGVIILVDFLASVTDLTIYSVTSGQSMTILSSKVASLTGSNFVYGDKLILSTVKGEKYIHLLRGTTTWNILNALGTNIDWFELLPGDNVFTFSAVSGIDNIQMSVLHNLVFEGL